MKHGVPQTGKMDYWVETLRSFIPNFLANQPILKKYQKNTSVILHGSITQGIDDPFTDIDLWFLLPEKEFNKLQKETNSLFFEIEVADKLGHLNVESFKDISKRIHQLRNYYGQPDMDTVFQLRNAAIIIDKTGIGKQLLYAACQPMRKEVSEIFFFYHYTEMRSEHRACDNPMERNDPVAFLLSLPKVIAHALRAAMVIDREPYPYDKWLYYAAYRTPTGKKIVPSINKILDLLAKDTLRFKGPESENLISQELRVIRRILIDVAHTKGNFSTWLDKWWLYMTEPRDRIKNIHW